MVVLGAIACALTIQNRVSASSNSYIELDRDVSWLESNGFTNAFGPGVDVGLATLFHQTCVGCYEFASVSGSVPLKGYASFYLEDFNTYIPGSGLFIALDIAFGGSYTQTQFIDEMNSAPGAFPSAPGPLGPDPSDIPGYWFGNTNDSGTYNQQGANFSPFSGWIDSAFANSTVIQFLPSNWPPSSPTPGSPSETFTIGWDFTQPPRTSGLFGDPNPFGISIDGAGVTPTPGVLTTMLLGGAIFGRRRRCRD